MRQALRIRTSLEDAPLFITEDVQYLTDQAQRCFRLARLCSDDAVAGRLRELGLEFARRAIALGADPRTFPKTN